MCGRLADSNYFYTGESIQALKAESIKGTFHLIALPQCHLTRIAEHFYIVRISDFDFDLIRRDIVLEINF